MTGAATVCIRVRKERSWEPLSLPAWCFSCGKPALSLMQNGLLKTGGT